MIDRLRWWLIKKLAGEDAVGINLAIEGETMITIRDGRKWVFHNVTFWNRPFTEAELALRGAIGMRLAGVDAKVVE